MLLTGIDHVAIAGATSRRRSTSTATIRLVDTARSSSATGEALLKVADSSQLLTPSRPDSTIRGISPRRAKGFITCLPRRRLREGARCVRKLAATVIDEGPGREGGTTVTLRHRRSRPALVELSGNRLGRSLSPGFACAMADDPIAAPHARCHPITERLGSSGS